MTFISILSNQPNPEEVSGETPECLADLFLDQVFDPLTSGKKEYHLKPFFYTPVHDAETIYYRQAVMQDLENSFLNEKIKAFTEKMSLVTRFLGLIEQLEYSYHKKGWFLEAALVYCEAITNLASDLDQASCQSRGFFDFSQYLAEYHQSSEFQSLFAEAKKVKAKLADIKYCVLIQNGKFKVQKYANESDYSIEVEKDFEKFKQGATKDYRNKLIETSGMNHIEGKILEFVARLYPEQFNALDRFCKQYNPFIDATIHKFDREIQFYISYLDFIAPFKEKGYLFCYPKVSASNRDVYAYDAFDLALARSMLHANPPVICNDFSLTAPEHVIVVSGANQGGKTTFARMFGQLHYLASLGCPVPGSKAQLFLFDQIYTHFEREEDINNLQGKLQDDLLRIYHILEQASPASILIMNEIFASTTWQDAVFLSKEIMLRVIEKDVLCVWVTFIDELSTLNENTVSMVSTVDPENPTQRTFKILRMPADGLAYAISIAKKHRLMYDQIKERIQS